MKNTILKNLGHCDPIELAFNQRRRWYEKARPARGDRKHEVIGRAYVLTLVDKHHGGRLDALADRLRASCCLKIVRQQRERLFDL